MSKYYFNRRNFFNSRFFFNPYLGIVWGTMTFYDLFKLVPKKEYTNPTIIGFISLKSFSNGFIGSFVPITLLLFTKGLYNKY